MQRKHSEHTLMLFTTPRLEVKYVEAEMIGSCWEDSLMCSDIVISASCCSVFKKLGTLTKPGPGFETDEI